MAFYAIFNNISVISCRSLSLVEETGIPGINASSNIHWAKKDQAAGMKNGNSVCPMFLPCCVNLSFPACKCTYIVHLRELSWS
jgi:hypothetical protein